MNIWIKIAKVAEKLDKAGLWKEADSITNVLIRKAYYYPGTNFPMQDRVIEDWDAIQNEAEEAEDSRLNSPRYKNKDFVQDSAGDQEDIEGSIFSLNGEPVSGITNVIDDGLSPSNRPDDPKWSFDNRNEGGRGYEKYMPHQY